MVVEDKKIGVGPSGWGRLKLSGLALPPWGRGWPNLCGYYYNEKYNQKMTIFPRWRKKRRQGLALRVGVGPSFLGSAFALGVGVGPSFLGSGLASFVWLQLQ